MKGKHPADLCPVLAQGKTPCPNCDFSGVDCKKANNGANESANEDLVAEITRRVIAAMGK